MKPNRFSPFDAGIIFMILGLVFMVFFGGWGMFFSMLFVCVGLIFTQND